MYITSVPCAAAVAFSISSGSFRGFRPVTATRAPLLANARAVDAPIPLVPPVTTHTLPASSIVFAVLKPHTLMSAINKVEPELEAATCLRPRNVIYQYIPTSGRIAIEVINSQIGRAHV